MHSPLVSPIPSHLSSSSERDGLTAPRAVRIGESGNPSRPGAELWDEENERLLAALHRPSAQGRFMRMFADALVRSGEEQLSRCVNKCGRASVFGLDVCDPCAELEAEPVDRPW